ncbi:uncharacterized protein LOC103724051 [Phoenix dactylifera]|uniref:Uncharacterized protein LOC103724051 n=1 Tax=Phoenix dactylifera TaxID=42345 RepID=A0A8B8IYW7_PHODC|nr:uncharacterized protein LOC103724051 [Phoenix dactylifera]XP_026656145.1 uncharacterized protein LOC103724051 [Phoenix dactylifera]
MLDWNDKEQVEGPELGDFFGNEDRTVPRDMETEGMIFTFGDQGEKQMKESIASDRRSKDQICGTKSNLRSCHLENISCYSTDGKPTASELDFDALPALPTVSSACSEGYNGGQEHDSGATEVMEDLIDNSKLNSPSDCMMECHHSGVMLHDKDSISADKSCSFSTSRTVQLDGEPELFGRVYEDEEIDGLLDFDRDTFEDIDFDTVFRNNDSADSVFGDEIVGISDGFLSPFTHLSGSTTQFIPKPDISFCKDETPDQGCCSIQLDEHPNRERNALQKEKADEQEKTLISWEQAEAKSKNKESCNLKGSWSHKTRQNQQNSRQKRVFSDTVPDVLSRQCNATLQENIENQKQQQQQTQAMIAIQQQQQKYGLQITSAGNSVSRSCSQKSLSQEAATSSFGTEESSELPSLEQNMLVEQDESQMISMLSDEHSLEETIYYHLQDTLRKLDTGLRLCIRDSVFRLARSATERQSISDSSSTNKSNKDEEVVAANGQMNNNGRAASSPTSETDTNFIDRIVAQLLFHRSSYSCL